MANSPAATAAPATMIDTSQDLTVSGRLRRALALPIYTVALILSFLSDMLGEVAAKIAGDPD
jgi:hypothetical protein